MILPLHKKVVTWGEIDRKVEKIDGKSLKDYTLTEYLNYNFGAMVFLPILSIYTLT